MEHFFDSYNDGYMKAKPYSMAKTIGVFSAVLAYFAIIFTSLAAYVTHVIACIKTASWIMLAFGLLPPIGVIHGVGLWFGWLN